MYTDSTVTVVELRGQAGFLFPESRRRRRAPSTSSVCPKIEAPLLQWAPLPASARKYWHKTISAASHESMRATSVAILISLVAIVAAQSMSGTFCVGCAVGRGRIRSVHFRIIALPSVHCASDDCSTLTYIYYNLKIQYTNIFGSPIIFISPFSRRKRTARGGTAGASSHIFRRLGRVRHSAHGTRQSCAVGNYFVLSRQCK